VVGGMGLRAALPDGPPPVRGTLARADAAAARGGAGRGGGRSSRRSRGRCGRRSWACARIPVDGRDTPPTSTRLPRACGPGTTRRSRAAGPRSNGAARPDLDGPPGPSRSPRNHRQEPLQRLVDVRAGKLPSPLEPAHHPPPPRCGRPHPP
jgi:hypothetical protein